MLCRRQKELERQVRMLLDMILLHGRDRLYICLVSLSLWFIHYSKKSLRATERIKWNNRIWSHNTADTALALDCIWSQHPIWSLEHHQQWILNAQPRATLSITRLGLYTNKEKLRSIWKALHPVHIQIVNILFNFLSKVISLLLPSKWLVSSPKK